MAGLGTGVVGKDEMGSGRQVHGQAGSLVGHGSRRVSKGVRARVCFCLSRKHVQLTPNTTKIGFHHNRAVLTHFVIYLPFSCISTPIPHHDRCFWFTLKVLSGTCTTLHLTVYSCADCCSGCQSSGSHPVHPPPPRCVLAAGTRVSSRPASHMAWASSLRRPRARCSLGSSSRGSDMGERHGGEAGGVCVRVSQREG